MIAALPMYDWPELRPATDAFWRALARALTAEGLDPPATLERDLPAAEVWTAPDLLLAQTCGLPLTAGVARGAAYVATPVYAVEGCAGPRYRSAIVARRGAGLEMGRLGGARIAANGPDSLSGWLAPFETLGPEALSNPLFTGAHRASVAAVAEGSADFAAIDAVAWNLARRFEPAAAGLELLGWTGDYPATPFITAAGAGEPHIAALRRALAAAIANPEAGDAFSALRLAGVQTLPSAAYALLAEAATRLPPARR